MVDSRVLMKLSSEDLNKFTDNFSKKNFLGNFQFGKVYRGKMELTGQQTFHFVVKIWDREGFDMHSEDNELRLMDEVILLRHEKLIQHPGMVTLFGYCFDGLHLAAAYDFKPMDSLNDLIPKDGFTWLQRIKVALGLAGLLKFLHTRKSKYEPFVVRNLDTAHIMLDEEYNPKLIDFGMITGGILPDRTAYYYHNLFGSFGYTDPNSFCKGGWTTKSDVYAFGIILLSLISKRVYGDEERRKFDVDLLDEWAYLQYYNKSCSSSLVDPTLAAEPGFCSDDGVRITNLAVDCVEADREDRPVINAVVKALLKLQVVKQNADYLNVKRIFCVVKAD